jgi:hypothetical protein
MVYTLSEDDLINYSFGRLTLHTYDFWVKGKSLDDTKKALVKHATKGHKVGEYYHNHVNKFISNTYDLLSSGNDECINAAKIITLKLALILAKKVSNEKKNAHAFKLITIFKELIRIGSSLEVLNKYVKIGGVEHNMGYFEHLLIDEINRFEKNVDINNGASIKDTLSLLSTIDIALKCKMAQYIKKRNRLVFLGGVTLTAVALAIF